MVRVSEGFRYREATVMIHESKIGLQPSRYLHRFSELNFETTVQVTLCT